MTPILDDDSVVPTGPGCPGPDPVPGLVREHGGDVEPPADLPRHLQKRPVFLLDEHHLIGFPLPGAS